MDVLNSLFTKAEGLGLLQPFTRGNNGQRISLYADDVALFIRPTLDIALQTTIGSGSTTKFWTDRWIHGNSINDLAPTMLLVDHRWAHDIQGGLSLIGLYKLFQLTDILSDFVLTQEDDTHIWRLDASGQYTAKSAYLAFFNGATTFEPWHRIWKTWAPAKCKIFLWLAGRNRCWTADRLARRNLPHPERCLFCDQEAEDIQHILTTCVFTRDFWFRVLSSFGWKLCVPSRHEFSFSDWWRKSAKKIQKDKRKGFNILVVLGAWIIWKHRNACVFEGARPSLDNLFQAFKDEHHLCMSWTKGV
ncbi:hypothetical protein PVAP13_4KG212210 [Panicum virgatum]|uniref:Reverse transcriptase zinc-binding domain-containing protein n=1 Tax=Panicum virgatum TaxID=38727 RepID=A0A8T0TSK7_PANVG|nr:hypothetical protein PVAP13_4KG212210 [Panicum virgatum]